MKRMRSNSLRLAGLLATGMILGSGFSQAASVTNAVAEIAPNDVPTGSTGNALIYDILATIGGADTGVDRITITVPVSFGAPTVTAVRVGGASVAFVDNTVGNLISVDLAVKVTSTDTLTVMFASAAPGIADPIGQDFFSTVDDSTTPDVPQATLQGDADGDVGDANSWRVSTTDRTGTVLLVAVNKTTPTAQDAAKRALFQSWGYSVTLIEATESQAAFDAAVAGSDVAYISEEITSGNLGTKLTNTCIGVVDDEDALTDELGISSTFGLYTSDVIDVTDKSHYITSPFLLGSLTIASPAQPLHTAAGTLAAGAQILAEQPATSNGTLVVIDAGGSLTSPPGGVAAGRRVFMPWGGGAFDVTALNANGNLLLRRALEWGIASPSCSGLSGRVFEDVNYGGGTGRDLATASADAAAFTVERDGVTVELYDAAGNFLSSTTTAVDGSYSFSVAPVANYIIRVVNNTVTSTRAGSNGTEFGVQTYRIDGDGEPAGSGAAKIGGEQPADADAPANSGGDTLAALQAPANQFTQSIVTVDPTGGDVAGIDFGFNFDTVVNTADAGQGSLRQFILNANLLTDNASLDQDGLTTGQETSVFVIPTTDPGYTAAPLAYTIQPTVSLPTVTDPVILDGTTQPGFGGSPIVELDGTLTASTEDGLRITAGSSTVRGFAINRFTGSGIGIELTSGGGNLIEGNYLGTDVTGTADLGNFYGIWVAGDNNTIGGTTAAARNLVSGNDNEGINVQSGTPSGNVIQGNFVGTDVTGTVILGNGDDGIALRSGSSGNTVGGTAAGAGNLVSGNGGEGIFLDNADVNIVQGNIVGTDLTGSVALGNVIHGILISSGANVNTIGGTTAAARNLVSGNGEHGIRIGGATTLVRGNYIGTDAAGSGAIPNAAHGILLDATALTTSIGGTAPGAANLIAFNGGDGVAANASAGSNNSILLNSIHSNTGLGIDLNNDGVTPNDVGDADTGPNDLLNYPVLSAATAGGGNVTVSFSVDLPAGDYRIEFFTNSVADGSGFGEGETFVDSVNIAHAGAGPQNFCHTFAGGAGDILSATTTVCTDGAVCSLFGSTSEFSGSITAVAGTTSGLSGTVFEDVNYGGGTGRARATAAADAPGFTVERGGVTVEFYDAGGNFVSGTTTAADGTYGVCSLTAAVYTVRVVNDTVTSTRAGSDGTELGVQTYRIDGDGEPAGTGAGRVGGEQPADVDAPANSGSDTLAALQAPAGQFTQSIVTVDASGGDVYAIDFGFNFNTIVNTNDPGQGSFRQFILNTNLLTDEGSLDQDDALVTLPAGYDHTIFMIPTSDPGYRPTVDGGTGNAFIINPTSLMTIISDSNTAIHGRTQTAFTGNTNGAVAEPPSGPVGTPTTGPEVIVDYQLAGFNDPGLWIQAANTIVDSIGVANVDGSTNRASGIRFDTGSDGSIVRNSTFFGNDSYGMRLLTTTNVTVSNNVSRTNGGPHTTADGIMTDSNTSNSTIVNNTFVGNIGDGIDARGSGHTYQGNLLKGNGATVKGQTGSDGSGIRMRNLSGSTTIDNEIVGNRVRGVRVESTASGNRVTRNKIYDNTMLGIDLLGGTEDGFGITANDAGDGDSGSNLLQNYPVLSSAAASGGNTTILGTLNSAANTTFTLEFFSSPAADPSGSGEGQVFLGADTTSTDGSGNASFNTVVPVAVAVGDVITATATDPSNNTSEFSAAVTVAAGVAVSGTVFEDVNYGGGVGRDYATASADSGAFSVERDNVTVELYDNAGDFLSSTTTAADGSYGFAGLSPALYTVRVVNPTVTSTRTGSDGSELAVQTFRADGDGEAAGTGANRVGGEQPADVDAPANSGSDTLAALQAPAGQFTQSIVTVDTSGGDVSGVDFGFNFDTIVNTNDSGQGSLRRFILNANLLTDQASLDQDDAVATLPAGFEHSIFRIPAPGNQSSGGDSWWRIAPTSALPSVSDANTIVDGTTQTADVGDTNTLGPEIEINGSGAGTVHGLVLAGDSGGVRGVVVNQFGSNGLFVPGNSNNIEGNYVGTDATGTLDLGNTVDGIQMAGNNNTIGGASAAQRNVLSGNNDEGIDLNPGATGNVIIGNYIGTNATATATIGNGTGGFSGGILFDANGNRIGGSAPGEGNVISGNIPYGILLSSSSSANQIYGNFIGTDPTATLSLGNTVSGIRLRAGAFDNAIGGTTAGEGNLIVRNINDGIDFESTTLSGNSILGNSIFGNGALGIDLNDDGITGNDGGDLDAGPNDLLNFAAIKSATESGGTVTVDFDLDLPAGDYRIEFFKNPVGADPSGNGEGESFASFVNINHAGAGVQGYSHGFPGVVGDIITSTTTVCTDGATCSAFGSTSEFSASITVEAPKIISGTVYHDANSNSALDFGEVGIGTGWVKLISGGSVIQVVAADQNTGAYAFAPVVDGTYTVIVDDNNSAADSTPTEPLNWLWQNPLTGSLSVTVSGVDEPDQDFGFVFDFNLAADCVCGYGDGLFLQTSITIDGNFGDWGGVLSDPDNNACDETDDADRDYLVQSTGRNLVRTAATYDATWFAFYTQRVGSANNTQNFIYYADVDNDGILRNGDPVIVALWQGNTGVVDLRLYTYDDLGSGGDPLVDANGFADGYTMPGDLNFVMNFPAGSAQGNTTGGAAGTQMEWRILWADLGVPPGTAMGWHSSSTNANPGSANLAGQIDDNLGGCGGQCTGSNQFGGVDPAPVDVAPGSTAYAFHTITNTGNGNDLFDITYTSSGAWAPVSVAYYQDLGTVGQWDPGVDTLLADTNGDTNPDTGNMAPGAILNVVVAIVLPGPPATGTAVLTTTVTSNFVPGCGQTLPPISGDINDTLTIEQTDMSIVKDDGVVSAVPGTSLTYTITVNNNGPDDSVGAQVADTFDPAFFDVANVSWTCAITGGTGSCADPGPTNGNIATTVDLDNGAEATFTVTAPLLSSATGTVSNTATVTAINDIDPDSSNDSSTDNDTVLTPDVDLVLAKTVDDNTPNEGDTVTYTIQLTNNGPDTATTIVVTDVVPAGVTYVPASISGGDSSDDSDPAGAGVSWTVNSLASGANTSLTFQATVDAGTAGSTIVNTATKTQDQVDSDSTADDPTEAITVQSVDLVLAKTVDNATPNEGDTVTYTIQLTNNGPDTATTIVATDVVPAGVTYVPASITGGDSNDDSDPAGAGLSWTVNSLASGANTSLTFQATVDAGTAGSTIVNTATKTQDQVDSDTTLDDPTEPITVQSIDLSLNKVVDILAPTVGSNVVFTLTVSNAGPSGASGVQVTDQLPTGYSYVSDTGGGTYDNATGLWTVGGLAAGGSATLDITATVNPAGVYLNTSEVTAANEIDSDSTPNNGVTTEDDYAEQATTPGGLADLSLAKAVDNATPLTGTNVTFTLTVSNAGPSAASGVAVTDLLPTGYTYVSDTGAGAYNSATGVWTAGALVAGGSATLDITATVNPAGVYLNTSEVTAANEGDPDSTPNNGVTTEDDYAEQATTPAAPTPAVTMLETVTDVNGGTLVPGDQLLYTITITNTGTGDATSVMVTDPIPANTTLVAGSLTSDDPSDITVEGNPVSIDVGTLFAPGNGDTDVVITYSVTVDLGVPAGTMITNQATLTAGGGMSRISDDPGVNDGLETGNDPLDPGDDDPTIAGPTVAGTGVILTVSKTADQREVQRGEFVLYTITVTNPTALAVSFVDLQDSLPVGVTLVSGTVTVDGVPAPDPGPAIPSLFPIGTINPGQTVTLVYRAVVGSGSVIGELVNTATAVDDTLAPLSLPASVSVRLIEDTEFDLATIVGRVFDDRDEDGRLDRGEKGIGGVMVAMEDGVYAITDNDGFYHIAAVRPGNRLIKVNRHSMPPFERMTLPESNILTVTPGLLVKVNFAAKISDARTLKRGRPASYGIQLTREKPAAQTEIVGNLEDMTVVVNGVLARLPKAHARMDVMSLERNLTIVDGKLEKPAVFELSYPSDRSVKEWRFEIFDADMQLLRDFRGTDADTKQVVWDGEDAGGKLVSGSEIYQYQLTIEFKDGSLAKSPVRMFGVDLTKAISFELTGALFETNQATLHTTAIGILDEIAGTLKQHPKEKVVVSGHTDSTGSLAWNRELSLRRAEAVRDYLVEAGISENQLLIKGRGSAYPVASNDTYAGRARNRRVEVKALLEETDLARVYASEIDAGAREVVVNDQPLAAETDGSFRTTLNQLEETGRVSLGIRTDDGGLTATTVHLPTITITEPSGNGKLEIGRRERVLELMEPEIVNGGVHHPKVEIPVRGRTEPGNMVFIDGEPAPVSPSGSFETKVPLTVGENTFGIVAIGPGGHTNVVNLDVDLSGKDADQQLIVVKPPIPQFTIELPPRDAVLPNPSLFVRGTADPLATVTINKTKFPVANDGAFAGTLSLPEGNSFIQVKVSMPDGSSTQLGVPITVKQNYFFVVALGDATVNSIETKGPVPEKYQDEVYVDGRLAFYLKGRIKGKYLLTAAMDTSDGRLEDIGDRLGERNNNDFFRTLDPDEFYPVYGDGSTTGRDVNSQGPFYVMFEAPTYSAEWGNFNSGITGTEFASFNRTLYGGKGTWTTLRKREHGEPVGRAIVFAAQPETRSGHDEFLGTGGSLYFLRNRDVARGSEKVRLEVRDKITGIAVANQAMRNYVDYEIDYAEGRLLFRRPVDMVSASSTIISDGLLNGNEVYVIVDYEYHELSTSIDESTYGARVTSAVSDQISVGATYVKEERATSTYDLVGGDVSVRLGDQTRMTAEFSQSDNTLLPQYVSTDGGLSFVAKPVPVTGDTNQAYRLDMATGAGPFQATGYFRHIDAGFSSSFATGLADVDQYGASLGFKIGDSGQLKLMFDERETQGVSDVLTGTLQYQQRIGKFGIIAEGRYRDSENVLSPDTTEGIGAIRFDFHATPGVNLFARHQTDFHQKVGGVSATTGIKEQSTIGVDAKITNNITAKAEFTTAEAGDSALVGLSTKIDEDTILYGTYTMSPDHASGVTDTVTAGAATGIGDRTRVYTEQQFKNGRDQLTTTNVVGLNVRVNDKLTAGVNVQRTNLDGAGAGPDTLRQAASGSVSYVHPRFKVFSKLELRQDEGTAVDREQWVTSNAFEVKLSKDLSLQGRLNYGETTDNLTNTEESVYDELSFGFAYRPHNHDWVNALARYTKVRNLSPMSQVLTTQDDREDQVFAFQISVDLNRHLTLTEKLARRDQTLTPALLAQLESELKLWINRFDYHLSDKWDAALEYRLLSIEDAADNQADGFLLEINRLLMGHLRFGLGYNFTNFSDDALTANDYEVKGFFFRIQGKY